MGFIKAVRGALSGTMEDIWKEMFVCDSLPAEVLMVRGVKQVSNRSANTGGDPNTITHGSVILVADGQCAVVVSGGRVIDSCSEPGEYVFHDPKHVSGLAGLLKETGERISFGGDALPRLQRVYYINVKESMDNPFAAVFPVELKPAGPNRIAARISCRGVFSYRISDPTLFYRLAAGNTAGAYTRSELTGQITSELLTALGPAAEALCAGGLRPSELPAHTEELCRALREKAAGGWLGQRGLEIISVAISSLTPMEGDMRSVQRLSRAAALFDAVTPPPEKEPAAAKAPGAWTCVLCGAESTGDFCPMCGKPRTWVCACAQENLGRFCTRCGKPRPQAAASSTPAPKPSAFTP